MSDIFYKNRSRAVFLFMLFIFSLFSMQDLHLL